MIQNNLIEIRCPFKRTNKFSKKLEDCHSLCIKVYPGSSGEAKCPKCKLTFEFVVDNQANQRTFVQPKQ